MRPYYDDGQIQIWHADCRLILPEIDPATVALVIADPPYGISHDTDLTRFGKRTNRTWARIVADDKPFDPAPLLHFGRCVLFGGNYYSDRLPPGRWIVWNKRDAMATDMLLADAEMAWHNCEGRSVQVFNWFWNGCYRKGEMGKAFHPAQKPVALMEWIIGRYTKPGDLILDPYCGSGPVPRACKNLGRRCVAVEIVEDYCATTVARLAQSVLPFEVSA